MVTRLIRYIVVGILLAFSMRLVWGRGAMFWRAWHDASRNYERASRQHTDCTKNHAMLHTWAAECHAAERTVKEAWPVTRAWTMLMDNTYLCVEVECAVLFAPFVATTTGLVAWCAILVVALCGLRIAWNAKPATRTRNLRDQSAFVQALPPPSRRRQTSLHASHRTAGNTLAAWYRKLQPESVV